jgi:hypothetical protein
MGKFKKRNVDMRFVVKMPEPVFEWYKDAKGKFRFRLKAGNGEIIAVLFQLSMLSPNLAHRLVTWVIDLSQGIFNVFDHKF